MYIYKTTIYLLYIYKTTMKSTTKRSCIRKQRIKDYINRIGNSFS